ncbi:MAG: hypothetical protein D3908_14475, partial [Candidatus Electrothrix sp. AUS4]|nr:hypothetical protein [Candidatus Electrothrix sp. AUS4]
MLTKKVTTKKQIIPANYIISPWDELEILHYVDPGYSTTDYVTDKEDKLRIDFFYYPKLTKTVRVRPDGFITLPKIGDIKAEGEKPRLLAKKISELFRSHLSQPVITIEVTEFNTKIQKFKETLHTANRGQWNDVLVRPDGRISLPYLKKDLIAAGKTAESLSRELENQYRKYIKSINVTVSIRKATSYQACVLGDVKEADYYNLTGPTTLLQLIAEAGGFTREANMRQVVIISRSASGKPEYRIKD